MKKLKILMLFSLGILLNCNSIKLNSFERESRKKAETMVNHFLKNNTNPYVLYSLNNRQYIIVFDEETQYKEVLFYIDVEDKISMISEKEIKKPDTLFQKAFNPDNYSRKFINFKSKFFKKSNETIIQGGPTYFVMKTKEGKRYGESVLSIIVKPNPLDKELYQFLAQKLINNFDKVDLHNTKKND